MIEADVALDWEPAMNVNQAACERIDAVNKILADEDSIVDAASLKAVVPESGSAAESWQLRRLRALNAQHTSTDRLSEGSMCGSRLVTLEQGQDGDAVETEVYWNKSRLVWSRSGVVLRLFSFDETVRCACWAWLEVDGMQEGDVEMTGLIMENRRSSVPQRVLCIFLESRLLMHFPHSGREYVKRLDFKIGKAFALDAGLIVQRLVEHEDLRRRSKNVFVEVDDTMMLESDHSEHTHDDSPLPTLFYLRRPYDDFRVVTEDVLASRTTSSRTSKPFDRITQEVLYVGQDPSMKREGRALLVAVDGQDRHLYYYILQHGVTKQTFGGLSIRPDTKQDTKGERRPGLARKSSLRNRAVSGRSSSAMARQSSARTSERARMSAMTPSHRLGASLGLKNMPHLRLDEAVDVALDSEEIEQEGMKDVIQLLDELDEVAEQNEPIAIGQTPNARSKARRTSRPHMPTRTPFRSTSAVVGEERTRVRPRTTSATHTLYGGMGSQTPSSMAARLTRSDDQSKQTQATQERPDLFRRRSGMTAPAPLMDADVAEMFHAELHRTKRTAFADESSYSFAQVSQVDDVLLDANVNIDQLSFALIEVNAQILLHTTVNGIVKSTHHACLSHASSKGDAQWRLKRVERDVNTPGTKSLDDSEAPAKSSDPLVNEVLNALDEIVHPQMLSLKTFRTQERQMASQDHWAYLRALLLQTEAKEVNQLRTPWDMLAKDRLPLVDHLLPHLPPETDPMDEGEWLSSHARKGRDPDLTERIVISLHTLAQTIRLDRTRATRDLHRLGSIILELCIELGWTSWVDHWTRLIGADRAVPTLNVMASKATNSESLLVDIYEDLMEVMKGSVFHSPLTVDSAAKVSGCYHILAERNAPEDTDMPTVMDPARRVVEFIGTFEDAFQFPSNLPLAIQLPIQDAVRVCKFQAPRGWPARLYALVGRPDLRSLCSSGRKAIDEDIRSGAQSRLLSRQLQERGQEIPALPSICYDLFSQDYRLVDVNNTLQTSRAVAVKGPSDTSASNAGEEAIAEQQKRIFVSASDRIKATSVGRGLFLFQSDIVKTTEQVQIAPVCLRIRMLAHCIVQHREPDAEGVEMEWPEFHNGTAAALMLAFGETSVESSWIYSQTGGEFSARNAGFIFGLGLCGQLRHLGKIHAHHYLSQRHALTSIGLLLGIAVSFVGTCDVMAKALMSIHLVHTLPAYSKPLKTTMLEQSAALVGLGYVFAGSNDHWASRMALKAMGTDLVLTDDSQMTRRECFSLSAGFSLGLVCLAKGREPRSCLTLEKEVLPLVERLLRRFRAGRGDGGGARGKPDPGLTESFDWRPDVSLTTTPATVALSLIYLRSNRADIAAKMPLPANAAELGEMRPDILLVRSLCRALIMWDELEPTKEWLDGTMPLHLKTHDIEDATKMGESAQLAYWAIRTGAIFAVGLRFAGSNDQTARSVLLDEQSKMQALVEQRPRRYFHKLRQQALRSAIDTLHSSLAMVCAGSGDVEILRILRRSLYKVDSLRYGNYMVSTMSIGLLFLGGGRFSLSSSDLAIASLLLAFFPRYPVNAQDNRAHLQAYRHLWTLAFEARLLTLKEIDVGRGAAKVPIDVKVQGKDGTTHSASYLTPCVLPKVDELQELNVNSDRYMPLTVNLQDRSRSAESVLKMRTLFVLPKKAMLGHDQDPFGQSALMSQTEHLWTELCVPLSSGTGEKLERDREETLLRRNEELQTAILSSTKRSDVHALVRSCSAPYHVYRRALPPTASLAELELESCMLQALVHSLRQDDVEGLGTIVTFFTFARRLLCAADMHTTDRDVYRIAQELHFANRLQEESKWSSPVRSYRDEALCRLSQMLNRRLATKLNAESVLVQHLHAYARLVDKENANAYRQYEACQHILPILLFTSIPPLGILRQVRRGLMKALGDGAIRVENALAFAQAILQTSKVQCEPIILSHFIHAWTSSTDV